MYYLIIKWSSTCIFLFLFRCTKVSNSLDFVRDWVWVCSPCMCKWKWFSFHLVFSEFGKIFDLVGQGSKRRSKGPNHYKLSVLNLSLTKIFTWYSYQYFSSNQKYSSYIFNHLNPKNSYLFISSLFQETQNIIIYFQLIFWVYKGILGI